VAYDAPMHSVAFPPIVGRKQAADILGVTPNHTHKIREFPPPVPRELVDTDWPAWYRHEIEALRDRRRGAEA
jgi:hypothetical protein